MNNGKICVSVCAETADEMLEKIKRAEEFADVIEVRFDSLRKEELGPLLRPRAYPGPKNIVLESTSVPIISTFRPKEQGGCRDLSLHERNTFWNSGHESEYCDVEEEFLDDSYSWLWITRILSFHDFDGTPEDLESTFDRLVRIDSYVEADPHVVKIAVMANDAVDAIPVWNLLNRPQKYRSRIPSKVIAIAMGEAGKWTRILGLAHGAFLTYGSLDAGQETAVGQITAKDLVDIYRVKDLDVDTQVYGVIGYPASASLSPYMHNPAFPASGVNAVFMPLTVKDLDAFIERMVRPATREVELNFGGFSVTMPHKQAIMRHLDEIDAIAKAIGAVNTVKMLDDGKLIGHNTDAHGFITPLKKYFGDLSGTNVAMIGAGGAARACVYALKQEGANVTVYARDGEKARLFADEFGTASSTISDLKFQISNSGSTGAEIVVNATPLGMKGKLENESHFSADELSGVRFVYDLVTKNVDTPLIAEAKRAGIQAIGGLEMLIAQGEKQFKIWTGKEAPGELMKASLSAKLKD